MIPHSALFLAVLFWFTISCSYALTTTVEVNGETIVQEVTTNGAGAPTTSILQTIVPPEDGEDKGPVGQPGATQTGTAPTPYWYTTTVDGVQTVIRDTFTPTNMPIQTSIARVSGSVWGYDDWMSQYGAPATSRRNAGIDYRPPRLSTVLGGLPVLASLLCSIIAAVWILL